MRHKQLLAGGSSFIVGVTFLISEPAHAYLTYLGWADEFLSGAVECNSDSAECAIRAAWGPPSGWLAPSTSGSPPTWSYVGMQNATTTGRANIREKILFRFRDATHTDCHMASVTLRRNRFQPPLSEGAGCSDGGGLFQASATETWSSCGFLDDDFFLQNRLLPTLNFSTETASANQVIGYKSAIVLNNMPCNGVCTAVNCYKVRWVP